MSQFYHDMRDPLVERMAKAIARSRGLNADSLVAETGYSNAAMVPAWWKFQDRAFDTLVVIKELGLVEIKP